MLQDTALGVGHFSNIHTSFVQDAERSLAILAMFQRFNQYKHLYMGKGSTYSYAATGNDSQKHYITLPVAKKCI